MQLIVTYFFSMLNILLLTIKRDIILNIACKYMSGIVRNFSNISRDRYLYGVNKGRTKNQIVFDVHYERKLY